MTPVDRSPSRRRAAQALARSHARRTALLAALACAAVPLARAGAPATLERWPAHLPTPDLDLPRLDGGRFRLSEARGRVVLLNFWASWCQPCVDELPALERLAARHVEQGLQVMAVNFRQVDRTVSRFVARQGLALPVLLDTTGSVAEHWTVRILPTSIVIDRQGRAALVAIGDPDWTGAAARQALDPLW